MNILESLGIDCSFCDSIIRINNTIYFGNHNGFEYIKLDDYDNVIERSSGNKHLMNMKYKGKSFFDWISSL